MKKLLFLLVLVPAITLAQKNNNGKVYDKHPALDIAEKFGQAWISGDVETLKSLVGEGFKMGNSMNTNPMYKGGDINNLIGQATWMKNNFVNISLKIEVKPIQMQLNTKDQVFLFKHSKSLLHGTKAMDSKSKLLLTPSLYLTKKERK